MLYVPNDAIDRIKEYYDKGYKIYLKKIKQIPYSPVKNMWGIAIDYAIIYVSASKEKCLRKLEEAEVEYEEVTVN